MGTSRRSVIALLAATALSAAPSMPPVSVDKTQRTVIAAASDLNVALPEIVTLFAQESGLGVQPVFGSSGVLTRQIQEGAPFELFLSADEAYVFRLADAGLTRDRGTPYALGHIVLFAPQGSPLVPEEGLDGLARLVAAGRVTRFAIANPAVAPYGRAAEAALRAHGLWDAIAPRLVLGENVSQAAQFAATGNAVGGIIAGSLASAPTLRARGSFARIPDSMYPPLRQRMVLLSRAGPAAERFYAFMQSEPARQILEQYGFGIP